MRGVDFGLQAITARMWLITACVAIWSLRLSIYIFIRHKREDYRYKEMRERWTAEGVCVYYTKAFVFVYGMQGLFSLINNASVLYVNLWSAKDYCYLKNDIDRIVCEP